MRAQLESQADRIEAVLSLHEAPARVTGGTVTPRWIRFRILLTVGAKVPHIKNLSEELAAALDTPSCRVSRRGAAVTVEVSRDDPQPVRLLPLLHQLQQNPAKQTYPPVTATLGLAEDGAPLLIRLPSPDVGHILVAGNEGAGKTTLLQTMTLSLAMTNSPDNLSFIFLGDGLPETARAVKQMGFSTYRIEKTGMTVLHAGAGTAAKRIIIIADDVMGDNDVATTRLNRLTKASAKHHCVLGWLGVPPTRVVDLFKVRLVGRMPSAKDARSTTGWSDSGAEQLLGQGDFLAVAQGEITHFQAACARPAELQACLTTITPVSLPPTLTCPHT